MADPDKLSQNLALAHERDAVVHLRNGSYGLIEVKLGGYELIKEGAESLKALSDKIDITKMKKPSFLMVLTGVGDYAYKRPEDGVLVVPIGCLKERITIIDKEV